MIITAYKSVEDGKIFEDKSKYQAHLRKLARHRLEQKKLAIAREQADAVWNPLYEREQSIEDWAQMVIDNQYLFWAEAARHNPHDWELVGKAPSHGRSIPMPCPKLLEFTTFDLRWNDSVSNSHSCPHNGVTNWGGYNTSKGAPTGYPGWHGRVDWIVAWPREWDGVYLGSDLFSGGTFRSGRQRAHTGSGGGGGMRYSEKHKCHVMSHGYSFSLYAADWPGLVRFREKMKVWNRLKEVA